MKLNISERVSFSNIGGVLPSAKHNGKKAGGFDVEMFNSAIIRLKTALGSRDTNLMNQTVDILLDFSQNDGVKTVVRGISKHISLCEYDQAEALLEKLA